MGQVADVVGNHRAPAAAVVRPAVDVGSDEGAVDQELPPALKQAQQIDCAAGAVECVIFLDEQPGHPPSLRGERVVGAHHVFLLRAKLLPGGRPFLGRYDRWCLHMLSAFPFQLSVDGPAAVSRYEPLRCSVASSSTDRPTCCAVSAGPDAATKSSTPTPCRSAYAATAFAPKSVSAVSRGNTDTK